MSAREGSAVTSQSVNTYAGNWGFKKVFENEAQKQRVRLPQVIYLSRGKSFYPGYLETTVERTEKKKGKANTAWASVTTSVTSHRMTGLSNAINTDALTRPPDFPAHPSLRGYLA